MIANLDLYRIFYIVSQHKSFSKAASELYMTQSAVSQAIMKLEKELDLKLFHRTRKGAELTNEGRILYEHLNSAFGIIQAAENKLLEFKMLMTGQLRIGVGDTISRYYLMPYLDEFRFKYPGVKINILNGTTYEICEFVKSGKADLGICNLPIHHEQLEIIPCKEIQDIFVCGEKYRRMAEKPISLRELSKFPLILLEKKSNSRMYMDHFFEENGLNISPMFELGSFDLLLEFTKRNFGISCVIKEFAEEAIERGELFEIPLKEEIPKRSIGIVYLKNVSLSKAAVKFIHMIQKF